LSILRIAQPISFSLVSVKLNHILHELNCETHYFSSRPWRAHVTVTPEASRIAVFSKGTCTGLNGWIPVGGQVDPSSVVGNKLVWKNSQKNNTKNKIFQTINRIIPYRRTFVAIFMCNSWYVPSRFTSRHHSIIIIIKFALLKTWNQHTVLICLCGKHLIKDMWEKFLFLGSVGEGLYSLFIFGSHDYNDTCVRAACNFESVYIFTKNDC
jgi:hypothetical protein